MIAAVGLLWLAVTLNGSSYAGSLLPGLLLSGLGHGVIYTCRPAEVPVIQEC
ncbi:MAG TPA: hypothetical protein VGD71_26200 [Kribbella sp.]|jgi:hypothetical protein